MSILKRGNKYWVSFSYNRVRYRSASPDNSKAGAKSYESLLRQKAIRGEPQENNEKRLEEAPTFVEFSKKWLDIYVKTNNKYSEVANKESILRAHLIPFFGQKKLNQIKMLDIENFKVKEINNNLSNKTINNFLIVLSKCLKVAQEWEVIEVIPRIKLLKIQIPKFDHLSEDESQLLLNNCHGTLKDMVLVALKTGLRFGELIALEWNDIDFGNNLMTVKQSISRGRLGSTKSNKIRFIPLSEEANEVLLSRLNERKFVFTKDDGALLGSMLCLRWLHRACLAAGLRKIGFHVLRHSTASQLAEHGVSMTIVKELLGHSDIRTTMRYSHLTQSATREAILLLTNYNCHKNATIQEVVNEKILLPKLLIQESIQNPNKK